jgi:hypothetical protein
MAQNLGQNTVFNKHRPLASSIDHSHEPRGAQTTQAANTHHSPFSICGVYGIHGLILCCPICPLRLLQYHACIANACKEGEYTS